MADAEKRQKREEVVATGFPMFDEPMRGGIAVGSTVVVAAPSGHGKTAMMVTLTYGFLKQTINCLWFSYEETNADINIKLLDGIRGMIDDNLMIRFCNYGQGHGLELWRSLQAEWKGTGNQVLTDTEFSAPLLVEIEPLLTNCGNLYRCENNT